MPIRFACEHCESTLSVSSRKAGHQVMCPKCRQQTPVPLASLEPAAVSGAEKSSASIRVTELAPQIQRLTDHYLDQCLEMARDGQGFDWIGDFAGRLPMDVISEMMGVPEPDRVEVRRLADLVVHREDGVTDVPAEAARGLAQPDRLLPRRWSPNDVRSPSDDLTSALLDAEIDGDRLTDDEIIGFMFLMVIAGNETTTKLLANARVLGAQETPTRLPRSMRTRL